VIDVNTVRELLRDQRWFGGKADEAEIVLERILDTEPQLVQLLVRVGDETYQLVVTDEARDITYDSAAALALLRSVAPGIDAATARPLGLEQSNTTLVYDETTLLKLFRRVGEHPNPDAEIPEALDAVGFNHVPPILARWQEGSRDYAVVQPFLAGATDGWALALVSLRQLFDEMVDPGAAGGDFAPESCRLGVVTARLHRAMADAFGSEPANPEAWAGTIADGLKADALRHVEQAGCIIRVHGDYHLGQVLRTDDAWYVVDFEGEPARTEHERRQFSSPIKDVAGMLRSFDYAAAVGTRERDEDGEIDALARKWERHNREAFLDGYRETMGSSALIPQDPESFRVLLEAFELDKALYEVAYESAHRPGWADIPKAAVARLVA
jgi:maltokinase